MPDSPVSEPVDLDSATAAAGLDTFLLGLDEHPYAVYTAEGRDIWRRGVAEEIATLAAIVAGTYWTRQGWDTPLGRWLCRRNRHHRVFEADPSASTHVRIIAKAFDVPLVMVCPRPICVRCGVGLGLSIRRWLGWERYGDG